MIVEDERIVAKDIQQTLAALGYDAFAIASSAEEALARASERCPDLVLMDIRIQGKLDGIETAAFLRERFNVPVVYLTAHADDTTMERAKQTEPHGYLLKPVKSAELRSAVEVSLHRHEVEQRLRERERWFSTTLHSIADAVITVDLAGNVTFMNPVAEQLTGVKSADAMGRPAREVARLMQAQQALSPLDLALERRTAVHISEATLTGGTPPARIVNDSAAPVIDAGKMLGAVMVFHDITEQRLAQKQLELADRLASLGTMAAGVAHEINNPLMVITVNATFVRDDVSRILDELEQGGTPRAESIARLREALVAQEEIQAASARITRIVSDLATFSRPPATTGSAADVRRAVAWAVRATAQEFRHRARVLTDLADVAPVALDETKLGQVLINLLINASHAIAPGDAEHNEVVVSARSSASGRVTIEVRDTGSGMPPEVLAQAFEPFFTTKPPGVGTGLGLAICHGIAASVGGSLQAESQVGHGSLFRLVLPTVAARAETERRATDPVAPARRRGRLLVIDDEELVRRVLVRILAGHEVVCADSARTALKLLKDGQHFDIVFSDLMMPDMTGMSFYEELLRSRPADARRVVFLTGGAVTPQTADFLATVPNRRLEKPFEAEELEALVQQILASDTAVRPAQASA